MHEACMNGIKYMLWVLLVKGKGIISSTVVPKPCVCDAQVIATRTNVKGHG